MAGKQPSKASVVIPQLGWQKVRPAPVVLVSGTESVLADRAIRLLRDTLRAEDPSLEVSDLEADGYLPGELLTLASPSLFGEPRFIRAVNVEKCTDAFIIEVMEYLQTPADGSRATVLRWTIQAIQMYRECQSRVGRLVEAVGQ